MSNQTIREGQAPFSADCLPQGIPGGFKQIFGEDFSTNGAQLIIPGGFTGFAQLPAQWRPWNVSAPGNQTSFVNAEAQLAATQALQPGPGGPFHNWIGAWADLRPVLTDAQIDARGFVVQFRALAMGQGDELVGAVDTYQGILLAADPTFLANGDGPFVSAGLIWHGTAIGWSAHIAKWNDHQNALLAIEVPLGILKSDVRMRLVLNYDEVEDISFVQAWISGDESGAGWQVFPDVLSALGRLGRVIGIGATGYNDSINETQCLGYVDYLRVIAGGPEAAAGGTSLAFMNYPLGNRNW